MKIILIIFCFIISQVAHSSNKIASLEEKNCTNLKKNEKDFYEKKNINLNIILINIEFYNYQKWVKLTVGSLAESKIKKINGSSVSRDKYKKNNKARIIYYDFKKK